MGDRFTITREEKLRELYPATHDLAVQKVQATLGVHAQDFIRHSPFLCLGTQDLNGRADVSPRGDPAGFVKILNSETLAIPDRPGNNRLDSLSNIITNPAIGLLFMIPGFDDTLRVNGSARLVVDPNLLETITINNRVPSLAIVVQVKEVFLHCAKALRRSQIWHPDHRQDRSQMPSLIKMILDETTGAPGDEEMRKIDAGLEEDYRKTMY
ncbi:pyridoxamine 5'-phosphate oxidase family protein [Rhizobium sp. CSW-27]|uniref:pyridoxamine 5'-phosphate oxidase family protein n=1 Tax=Rhizobium sp. CSW-27 TaxID=2839985 RepID=UPI001C01AE57|nr:pyridoxamine 5'-phosphate oxidase family protein [Rhizobium sp. CSW-27]MBT9372669.1 pyridoxamine 5'-phosphate oxidase family protein [Rhizobium sp. CSW-27]